MSNQPIILLTFAKNDLNSVSEEAKQIHALVSAQPLMEAVCVEDANKEKLGQSVADIGKRLRMYHFSGHANPHELVLDDFMKLDKIRFSRLLKSGGGSLDFVFLNGCHSYGHVAHLTANRVKAVIVTSTSIGDRMATKLSIAFYKLFFTKNYTLQKAFEGAEAMAATGYIPYLHIAYPGEIDANVSLKAMWTLVINEDYKEVMDWTLANFLHVKSPRPQYWTLPPIPNDVFIGRVKDLLDIERDFDKSQNVICLVNGEGGIGKTTLATEFWHRYEHRYQQLAWLYSATGIGDSLRQLGLTLGLRFEPNDSVETHLKQVVMALNRLDKPCLLVFDNANNPNDLQQHYPLLQQLRSCQVLLTTRATVLGFGKVHRIGALSETEALQLFSHHYKTLQGDELVMLGSILHAVGFNTLVIELLAKNLKVWNQFNPLAYPLVQLLAELQTRGLFAVQTKNITVAYQTPETNDNFFSRVRRFFSGTQPTQYLSGMLRSAKPEDVIKTMYSLVNLSKAEISLLSNLAVMPSKSIAYQTLIDLLQPENKDAFEETLTQLRLKGWLYFDENKGFKSSPVVQAIVREQQKGKLFSECFILMKSLAEKLRQPKIQEDTEDKSVWVSFAEAFVHHFDGYAGISIGVLQTELASKLKDLGNYHSAEKLFEKAMRDFEITFGEQHLHTVRSYKNLAIVRSHLGNYSAAKTLLEKVIRFNEAHFGKQHPETALSYSLLARVHRDLSDYSSAKTLLEKVSRSYTANFGEYDSITVAAYSDLAVVLSHLGDSSSAKKLVEKVMRSCDANFEELEPNTAGKLANVLQTLGNYSAAKILLEKASRSYESSFGKQHPLTAGNYCCLATVHMQLGNHAEAKILLEKSLSYFQANFGELHPSTAIIYSNLGLLLRDLGNHSYAKRLLEKAVCADEVNFGFKNLSTARSYSNLAIVLYNLGNYSEAKRLLEKAYSVYHNHLGAKHPTTKIIKDNLDGVTNAMKQ
jgi:tetratricopeptide (TPR) repeat protein